MTDFVSGTDKIDLGGPAGQPTNLNFATVSSDSLSDAVNASNQSATDTYTFVTGMSDSFLIYNGDSSTTDGAENTVTAIVLQNTETLVASDIVSGTSAIQTNGMSSGSNPV